MHTTRLNGVLLNVADPGDPGYEQPKTKNTDTLRVSEKGAVSLYGLRRFPVTLYADEWEHVASMLPQILDFINAHPELSRKGQ